MGLSIHIPTASHSTECTCVLSCRKTRPTRRVSVQANKLVISGKEEIRRFEAAVKERDARWTAEAELEEKLAEEARMKVSGN